MTERFAKTITAALAASLTVSTAFAQVPPPPRAPAAPAPAAPAAKGTSVADGYVLGPTDLVEVTVLGRDEFKPRVQVQADGTIQLPFIGTMKAADLTVLQLREAVRSALVSGGYYAAPIVNVAVVNYASRYAIVLGEVQSPGLVPVDRAYRVSEIIARVGGTKPGADTVTLVTAAGETTTLNVNAIATSGPDGDPIVNPGDKLFVPPAKTFYIYGQVTQPGTYPIDKDMTLRKALARGGGLTELGSEKKVKLFRDGKEIKNFDPAAPIKDGDVIVIGERFF